MFPPGRVALLLFGSGFCALVYQIAWFRALRLVFGASTAANAAVLAIFMGGLGFGGWLLGRRADRHPNPLRLYAHLELGIAGLAVLSPFLIDFVRWAYLATGGTLALGSFVGTVVRLALAVVVLGGPVVLMGGTLPAVARACQTDADTHRRSMALLYGANTFGSVMGALLGTFFLSEMLGARNTIVVAAALNALVAMVARSMSRRGTPPPAEVAVEETEEPARRPAAVFVMFAAAVVGFAFFLMELVWYRMLGPILGGSSYTFGMILACALLGIGIGGFLYSLRDSRRPVTLTLFAITCLAEALLMAFPLALGDDLALLALFLRPLENLGFGGMVLGWLGVNLVVILPGAIVAGYQFPLLVALLGSGRRGVGREVGLTYAWNTVGSILGSLAGGFGLLPLLSAPGAWRLVIVVLVVLGVAALLTDGFKTLARRAVVPGVLAALSIGCVLATGPGAVWRHSGIGAGRAPKSFGGETLLKDWMHLKEGDIIWETDGTESSVALNARNGYAFVINGKIDGNARGDAPTQVMLGVLGAVLHPEPENGFVIGLGTGSTAGWLGAVPSIEHVDVVEFEEAVVRIAEVCHTVNEDVLNNPRVNLIIGDAREVLPTSRRTYDLILSEPSNPYRAGIASLFTQEFYESAHERLADDGLFLQWLQTYEVDARTVRIVYTTLQSVFPHVDTWVSKLGGDIVLVASKQPIRYDLEALEKRTRQEPFKRALSAVWGVEGVHGLFTGFVANEDLAAALAAEGGPDEICTDDNALVEFGFARSVGHKALFQTQELDAEARTLGAQAPKVSRGALNPALVTEMWQARVAAEDKTMYLRPVPGEEGMARQQARTAYAEGRIQDAWRHWQSQPGGPVSPVDRIMVAEAAAWAGDASAEERIAAIQTEHPTTAATLGAVARLARGDRAAREVLLEAFTRYREDPWPLPALMDRALGLLERQGLDDPAFAMRLIEALDEPFAAGLLNQRRKLVRTTLGLRTAFEATCVDLLEQFEPYPPWNLSTLTARVRCYQAHQHPRLDDALADRSEFLSTVRPRLIDGEPASEPVESAEAPVD